MRYSDDLLRRIFRDVKTIACVGASSNPERPSHSVTRYLGSKGYRVIPVNPGLAGQELLGETVVGDLADVPPPVDMVDIFRRSEAVQSIGRHRHRPLRAGRDLDADRCRASRGGREGRGCRLDRDPEPLPQDRIQPSVRLGARRLARAISWRQRGCADPRAETGRARSPSPTRGARVGQAGAPGPALRTPGWDCRET